MKKALQKWDFDRTEFLLEKLEEVKANRIQEDLDRRAYEIEQLVMFVLTNCVY